MKVRYLNYQTESDSMNGAVITDEAKVAELLNGRRNQPPFLAELAGDNGFQIMMGIGRDLCCVQYSPANGKAPYLMAVSFHPPMKTGYVEFLTANTPTAIASRYIISFDELKVIAFNFLKTGERSGEMLWQELDPRAIKEDAERHNSN
jgi:hypothetical protein